MEDQMRIMQKPYFKRNTLR